MNDDLAPPSIEAEPAPGPGHSHGLGLAAVAAAASLWALSANVARTLFDDGMHPFQLAQSRAYLAFLGLALLRPFRREKTGSMSRSNLIALGIAIVLVNGVYYLAIQRLDVAVAIVLEYTAPALVVGWTAITLRRWPPASIMIALVAAVTGVALVAEVISTDVGRLDTVGLVAGVASAFFFATYTILSEQAGQAFGPVGAMFRAFFVSSVVWILFQIPQGLPEDLLNAAFAPRVLFVGVAGTILPFLLYVWGIQHVKAERAAIAATLEPPLAGAIAWVWLDQLPSLIQIAGSVLVLAAVVSLQTRRRKPLRAPDP